MKKKSKDKNTWTAKQYLDRQSDTGIGMFLFGVLIVAMWRIVS